MLTPNWTSRRRIQPCRAGVPYRATWRRLGFGLRPGIFGWMPAEVSKGRARKLPDYIHVPREDALLAFAGLYEWWHADANSDD